MKATSASFQAEIGNAADEWQTTLVPSTKRIEEKTGELD